MPLLDVLRQYLAILAEPRYDDQKTVPDGSAVKDEEILLWILITDTRPSLIDITQKYGVRETLDTFGIVVPLCPKSVECLNTRPRTKRFAGFMQRVE